MLSGIKKRSIFECTLLFVVCALTIKGVVFIIAEKNDIVALNLTLSYSRPLDIWVYYVP